MKVPSHIVGLYYRSVRRYYKLTSKLRQEKNAAGYRYCTLLQKLRKLRRKIATLQFQLKIATASGALVLSLSLTPAQAQTNNGPFVPQPRHLNPLREPFKFDGSTYPTSVDLDKDGDFDLVVGDEGNYNYNRIIGPLRYLLNVGTNANPIYEELSGTDNPFSELSVPTRNRGPVFADIDKDGDQDLFVGIDDYYDPRIMYFKNEDGVFEEETGTWDPLAKTGNPFESILITNDIKLAFVDLDKDNDLDAFIAGALFDDVTGTATFINYFKNDGQGTFTEANDEVSFSPKPNEYGLNPAFADLDKDGDADLVLGGYYYGLHYFKQVSPGNFVEETGPYDPGAKTGNPFEGIYESNTQPLFVDLDHDSDLDLVMGEGDGDHYYRYPDRLVHFFENTGNNVFEERLDLENPFGGVDVKRNASPLLTDLDSDGDLDALIGHKYDFYYQGFNIPVHYNADADGFHRQDTEISPFGMLGVYGAFIPVMVDLDADGDLDVISGDYYGQIHFFENIDGEYTDETASNPFEGIDKGNRASAKLADIDGDGDFDLALSTYFGRQIYFFENVGTAQVAQFEERVDTENPFSSVAADNNSRGFFHLADVDHDGDLDLLSSEYFYFKYYSFNMLLYYENTGTATEPVFEPAETQPFMPDNSPFAFGNTRNMQPYLADQDNDGDLDVFIGDYFGQIHYMRNENPAVVATVAADALTYRTDTDDDLVIDATLGLSDDDGDLIVRATVTIGNYAQGDELVFTPKTGISGVFNSSTGILTFSGKATMAEYETILRTVAYRYHENASGGRTRPGKKLTVSKPLEFRVYDTDFTRPVMKSRTLNVIFNNPPALQDVSQNIQLGTTVTIDLAKLMSDPDGNLDVSTLRIVEQPSSGAVATITADQQLIINYDLVSFTGADKLVIEVCDDLGECVQNLITLQVQNSGEIEVFNAVAPNSSGDNRYMRIFNLPEGNKVSIYNRWGDKVLEIENYNDNVSGKRFEGLNDNGKALPSGIYFYKIDINKGPNVNGPTQITGYISLKQ